MKHLIVIALFLFAFYPLSFAQEILNVVYVGEKGVTETAEEARFMILVKQTDDSVYARVEYAMNGPLQRVINYRGSEMKEKHGPYLEYYPSGFLSVSGRYSSGRKDGVWYYYNDSLLLVRASLYRMDEVLYDMEVDISGSRMQMYIDKDFMLRKVKENEDMLKGKWEDRVLTPFAASTEILPPVFPGGDKALNEYMRDELRIPDKWLAKGIHESIAAEFTVATDGTLQDLFITKSVEFSIDEEYLLWLREMPRWKPAYRLRENRTIPLRARIPVTLNYDPQINFQ